MTRTTTSAVFCIGYSTRRYLHGWHANSFARSASRRYFASRFVVDRTFTSNHPAGRFWRLRHFAGFRRRLLFVGTLSFAFLFPAHRSAASLVAALSRAFGAGGSPGISRHLLLLPQSLLSRIFSRSARVRRGRARQSQISRRNGLSIYFAKCASLFSLSRDSFPGFPVARRDQGFLFRRAIWHRRRQPDSVGQHYLAFHLYAVLPFTAPFGGRQVGLLFLRILWNHASGRLARLLFPERAAHAIRVGQLDLRGLGRFIHPPRG